METRLYARPSALPASSTLTGGIERVPENERTDTSYVNMAAWWVDLWSQKSWKIIRLTDSSLQWLSANMVVSSFAIGVLAIALLPGLSMPSSCACSFNLLGVMTVCFSPASVLHSSASDGAVPSGSAGSREVQ